MKINFDKVTIKIDPQETPGGLVESALQLEPTLFFDFWGNFEFAFWVSYDE